MGRTRGEVERRIPYLALPSQKTFHSIRSRFKGFSGPIGSGKSQALCQEALRLAYVNAGRTGLIGAPTFPMLRDATLLSLLEVLGDAGIPYELNKGENYLFLKDTRSRILLRSLDDFERVRGTNLAWFGIDELTYTVEEAWTRLEGRLRDPKATKLCGFAVWTPKGYDWVYRRFISAPVRGYGCVQAQAFENRFLLDKVPDFYERLKESYDETFYQQEALGEYVNSREGLVYRAFDRKQNVRPVHFDPRLPLHWALDFNVNPMSSVVAQVDGSEVRVLNEVVLKRAGTRDACEAFYEKYPRYPEGLIVYADASATRMQTAGTTDKEILHQFFEDKETARITFRIPRSNPAVRDRLAEVNAKLRSAAGEVHLLVDPRCKELILDFEGVTYVKNSAEIDKDRDPKRTHLSDALGYLIWHHFHRGRFIGEQRGRLL
jgi:hypothetical protein